MAIERGILWAAVGDALAWLAVLTHEMGHVLSRRLLGMGLRCGTRVGLVP